MTPDPTSGDDPTTRRRRVVVAGHTGDVETARLYEKTIHPEESHHHHRGRQILEKYATTPEIQQTVRTAVNSSLAIADELRNLMEKSTGLASIPLS